VPDVDRTVGAILAMLRPGGRFCLVVPMNEFIVTGPLPVFAPPDGVAGHVRVFTEDTLRERFGAFPGFVVERSPARGEREDTPRVSSQKCLALTLRRSLGRRRWPAVTLLR